MIAFMREQSDNTRRLLLDLIHSYHTPEEIVTLFSRITDSEVHDSFRMFPPFYTDFGKNIHVGKNVFINSCCQFQDQGGIFIGDGALIGHSVVLATLNHGLAPEDRQNLYHAPIRIGKGVWIGAHATILAGVTIGDDAVIDLYIHLHDVAAFCVADFTYAVRIVHLADIAGILKMIHYLIAIKCHN